MTKDPAAKASPRKETPQQATKRAVDELSATWREAHEARTAEIEAELLKDRADTSADERLLLRAAARDAALGEKLGQTEQQLADRALALIDNVAVGLQLARTLRQVVACHDVATRRLQALLETVGVLRGQRRLAATAPLRRVA